MSSTILRFVLPFSGDTPQEFQEQAERFRPGGELVLNSTEWRGKAPRTCGVTRLQTGKHHPGQPTAIFVEVTHKPKGHISFLGSMRYDGWDAAPLDRSQDGTLLDGHGQPLKEGEPPVHLTVRVFKEMDYNDLDFGDLVEEVEAIDVPRTTFEDAMEEIKKGPWSMIKGGQFVAPHRSRPTKKLILSNQPTGDYIDGFGTYIRNLDLSTPEIDQVLLDELTKLMFEFIEGRVSVECIGNEKLTWVNLSKSLVDCSPSEAGFDSFFDVLSMYTPITFVDELAKRIKSQYAVDVSLAQGENGGFLLRRNFSSE